MEEKNKGNGKNKILIIIIIVLALALVAAGAVLLTGGKDGNGPGGFFMDDSVEMGDREQMSQEEIQAELNKKVQEGMINISMNTYPTFENGKAKGNLLIVNEEINNYPQIVEIYILDADGNPGQLIYKSGGIPVGGRIDYDSLDVDLDKGSYNCVAYFHNADPETGASLGKAGAQIVIQVLN